ncbi:MAG: 30S ribosomal protein S2 [Alphaproteobacteria bacterium]|nr:30S ribosomal protein S2 [Alphaproteobacteria bacterium]
MAMPEFTMRQLLEAGVHFGHHTRRWNPKMRQHIFGVRNGVHIIDLQQTTPMLGEALKALRDIVANGGRVLFVGTKRQASSKIAESAKRCGQYFVNHRWLGGMLTNWQTISKSIARLRELEEILSSNEQKALRTKKELLMLSREHEKLELSLGGIKDMGGQPDAVFIIDVTMEDIAVQEANKLGVPVFAVVDTNADPKGVDYVIPGNDDALRAIDLYCDLVADAVLDGLEAELASGSKDPGAAEEVNVKLPPKPKKEEEGMTPGEAAKLAAEKKKAPKKADKKDEKADAKDEKAEDAKKADEPANEAEEKPKKQASA